MLPRCTLRVLPGCTHSVLWEQTGRVRDELADWFAGQDPAGPAAGSRWRWRTFSPTAISTTGRTTQAKKSHLNSALIP